MTQAAAPDASLEKLRAIEADIVGGRFAAAAAGINAFIAATPTDPRIYLSAAMLAHAAKNPQQELVALQHAVSVAPQWPNVYVELAKVFSRQGAHANAVAAANKAVELAPREMQPLEVAVAVANAAGDSQTAQRHLQAALTLKPGDVGIHRALGMSLENLHRYGEAETHWRAVLAMYPDDVSALGWLGLCLNGQDRRDEAREVFERALTLAPDQAGLKFHLAVARGETPPSQPMEMVQPLFDGYATRFDSHLVEQLKYRVPVRVVEIIRAQHPQLDVSVLDLGCGTGLLGAHLGRVGGRFVGVDVSLKMVEQAVKRDVYTKLRQNDLLAELRETPAESFDYAVANDVFIYVGDLSDVIPETYKVLRNGGTLIFSCETAQDEEGALVLRPSRRYAHSRASIEALCRAAGFESCTIEPIDLRMDGDSGLAIAGFIAVARKR